MRRSRFLRGRLDSNALQSISLALVAALVQLSAPSTAHAATATLRRQTDLHGDVAVTGSSLAWDCGNGLTAPANATISCAGQQNVVDSAPDLYWRDNVANASITPVQARSSASLTLPSGAKVTYARLYWAALKDGATPDTTATLDCVAISATTITADQTWVSPYPVAGHPTWNHYQASGDATAFVSEWGAGDFRVTDVESIPLGGVDVGGHFAAWTLVVFYELETEPLRNLALFDGFLPLDAASTQKSVTASLSGIFVPAGFSARMSAFMYEGDSTSTGDHFTVNGANVSDALNPADNFFNSTRTFLGSALSGPTDVPKLSGLPHSMGGYDLDTVDVTTFLQAGQTSATVGADSTADVFFMGGFATSISTKVPDFAATKTVVDVNGGALLQGDVVQYTLSATNGGNDDAIQTLLTDTLDPGLSYLPGSLEIVSGGANGTKSDLAGDDQAEYDVAARTVTFRLGTNATGSNGGTIAQGASFSVRFKATVVAAKGTVIANVGEVRAKGVSVALEKTWLTDGNSSEYGRQPTTVKVDECDTDAQCSDPLEPLCDLTTRVCGPCVTDADCGPSLVDAGADGVADGGADVGADAAADGGADGASDTSSLADDDADAVADSDRDDTSAVADSGGTVNDTSAGGGDDAAPIAPGSNTAAPESDGSCGCETPGGTDSKSTLAAVGLGLFVAGWAARRRGR